MPDTSPPTHLDDPVTATLMEGINEARILLNSHEHKQDLAELAKISNDLLRLDERRVELQAAVTKREGVYVEAERQMAAHLQGKHSFVQVGQVASEVVSRRPRPDAHHAANCAITFGDPCDCQ